MANDFFSRVASKIDDLFQLLVASPIISQNVAARSSLEIPANKLEDIKALLYDSRRQIREYAIKLWLKELQDLIIVVEDFVDDYEYKMFQREAGFISLPRATLDFAQVQYIGSLRRELRRRQIEARPRLAKGKKFEKLKIDVPDRNKSVDSTLEDLFNQKRVRITSSTGLSSFKKRPVAIDIPFNIVVRIVGMKRDFDDLVAQLQKAQKCSSHLLLISQEKQNSEKLQRVTEFPLAESSNLKSIKDLNYFPEDAVRGRKHYNAFDVTK